jgi:Putative Actinobacterial Holin-X, holin superfamily III/PRC-barrel domain
MIMPPQSTSAMDWEGRTLLDRDGDKIGRIEEIFLVEETGRPEWALVKLGRIGGRTTLVPLIGAQPTGDGIRAAHAKSVVSEAPKMDGDSEPSEAQVAALYRHYDIPDAGDGHAAGSRDEHAEASQPPVRSNSGNGVMPPPETVNGSADLRDEPVADLVKQVRDEAQALLSRELKLAKAEMSEKAKEVGIGAGMLGGAGYLGHLAALGLMLCVIFALATFMPAWAAALIVTIVFVAGAGALALIGRKRIQKAGPPIPEESVKSVKQTIETVKEEAKWGLGQTR